MMGNFIRIGRLMRRVCKGGSAGLAAAPLPTPQHFPVAEMRGFEAKNPPLVTGVLRGFQSFLTPQGYRAGRRRSLFGAIATANPGTNEPLRRQCGNYQEWSRKVPKTAQKWPLKGNLVFASHF